MDWNDRDAVAISALTPPEHYFGAINDLVEQGWGQFFGVHRDSDIHQQSNWDAIIKIFEDKGFEKYEDWRVEHSNHFLVGWADTMMIRILKCKCEDYEDALIVRHPDWESRGNKTWHCHTCNSTAQYTPIFTEVLEIRSRLEDYPILDEDVLSQREHEDLMKYLTQEVGEEHVEALHTYLSDEHSVSSSEDVRGQWIEEWKEENL